MVLDSKLKKPNDLNSCLFDVPVDLNGEDNEDVSLVECV